MSTVSNYRALLSAFCLLSSLLAPPVLAGEEVNIYSARKEDLIKPLLDDFSKQTGVTVNLVTGKEEALLQRLQSEGANTPADVLLTSDAGRLAAAQQAGVLQAVKSEALAARIPASYRDPAGYWYGLSVRARPIVYAKERVKPAELSTYEDLAAPKWKGKICVRSSDSVYNQSLVAGLISHHGEAKTETWAKGLVANFAHPPKGGDRDQIKAVAAGECDLTLVNTYYLGGMVNAQDAAEKQAAAQVAVFWPNQKTTGVHVNISGAGVTAHARHRDSAVRLLEFLAGDSAQRWYADVNAEYPVNPAIPPSVTLKAWGEFKADTVNVAKLGELNAAAVRVMDRAGWK
ncbi:MAG: Fe(3+) ABC transporter substrate-binding protein [Candidatus Competibacter sp.]|nr:Fe(3+) ABC transporter substrate-binding protein [Candidatus Competibacter sp.]MDG4606738.1 Fe(3+) ABC transporter substrate-binding protein [Candidatus Contendobacter sp.]HRD48234.1 Fe(3+) ABC transporter substrate-binding protein [Candidatus Contendobacter sp.]